MGEQTPLETIEQIKAAMQEIEKKDWRFDLVGTYARFCGAVESVKYAGNSKEALEILKEVAEAHKDDPLVVGFYKVVEEFLTQEEDSE